jgi:predicted RNA-binding protein (virulence factor B family)
MKEKYKTGQKVELEILRETDLGFVAKINQEDEGLLYHEEIFELLEPGQKVPGYIKKVREDNNIDLILQNLGYLGTKEFAEEIYQNITEERGFIPINAKSPAKEVHYHFLVSRNKFKMALGYLYKNRLVEVTDEGTRIVDDQKN